MSGVEIFQHIGGARIDRAEDVFFNLLREFGWQTTQFVEPVHISGAGRMGSPRFYLVAIWTAELHDPVTPKKPTF